MLPAHNAAVGAAAAAAAIKAAKATGTIVRIESAEFMRILGKVEDGLVVHGIGGFWKKKHQYLTNYKGIFFFTETVDALQLSYKVEVIEATNIWVPSM